MRDDSQPLQLRSDLLSAHQLQQTPQARPQVKDEYRRTNEKPRVQEAVRTQTGFTYGENVNGYGRNELATLYMTKKLSLAPERVARVAPMEKVAVILNAVGEPVLADRNWKRGLGPLISDPAFHGNPSGS